MSTHDPFSSGFDVRRDTIRETAKDCEMKESNEVKVLRQLIVDDERALETLQRRETELLQMIKSHDFHAATSRERILSDMQSAEARLQKNRLQLASLTSRA